MIGVREGHSEEVTVELRPEGEKGQLRRDQEELPGGGGGDCKGPREGLCLQDVRDSREVKAQGMGREGEPARDQGDVARRWGPCGHKPNSCRRDCVAHKTLTVYREEVCRALDRGHESCHHP